MFYLGIDTIHVKHYYCQDYSLCPFYDLTNSTIFKDDTLSLNVNASKSKQIYTVYQKELITHGHAKEFENFIPF